MFDAGEDGSYPSQLLFYVRHEHEDMVMAGRFRLMGAAVVPDPEPLGVPRIVAVVTTDRACLAMRLMLEPDMERRGRGQGRRTRHAQEGYESARTPQGTGHLAIVDCFRFHVNTPAASDKNRLARGMGNESSGGIRVPDAGQKGNMRRIKA